LARRAAVAVGYSVACSLYAAIFAVALLTLGLVLIRQANMLNFNNLVANLEQRDRAHDGLPQVLKSIREQQQLYADVLHGAADCLPVFGRIRNDEQTAGSPALSLAGTCDELQNTIKNHANELRLIEDKVLFKLANIDAWYMDYVAGMTEKMPQIIPALRFIDSGSPWINAWARSSFDLMEMFLLMSMGMLGGIISVTRWLMKPAARPFLSEYFYRPALGGIMALGAFVVFKAGQVIIGAQAQDGATAVAASVFLLAALGLVSGLCADKALERIEKAAGLFRTDDPAGPRPRGVAHLKVVEPATAGDGTTARPGRMARPRTTGPADEPAPENPARERA
jgi:hypothetical protein